MSNQDKLTIFDTTLRDGEQSPGASMTRDEKVRIAKALERMRVDVIEAGFPIASPGDFKSVQAVARAVSNSTVCGLARALDKDIDRAGEALADVDSFRLSVEGTATIVPTEGGALEGVSGLLSGDLKLDQCIVEFNIPQFFFLHKPKGKLLIYDFRNRFLLFHLLGDEPLKKADRGMVALFEGQIHEVVDEPGYLLFVGTNLFKGGEG